MLVRYRTNSNCTIDDFKSDINKLITGDFSTINDLSSGVDKTNSIILGSYPSNTYSVANSSSFTYSKDHNDYANTTHYFRLTFDSTSLNNITLARDYDSGTDALINSQDLTDEYKFGDVTASISITGSNYDPSYGQSFLSTGRQIGDRIQVKWPQLGETGNLPGLQILPGTRMVTNTQVSRLQTSTSQLLESYTETANLNIFPVAWDDTVNRAGIDIIITDKCFFIAAPQNESAEANTYSSGKFGLHTGIFDLGKSGVSREYSNSMLMCSLDLDARICKVPYHYRLDTKAYGSLIDQPIYSEPSFKQYDSSGQTIIVENPTYMQQIHNSMSISNIYGLYRVPPRFKANYNTYRQSGGTYRWFKDSLAILID